MTHRPPKLPSKDEALRRARKACGGDGTPCAVYRQFGYCAASDCPYSHPPCRAWMAPPHADRAMAARSTIALLDASQLVFYQHHGPKSQAASDGTMRGARLLQRALEALKCDGRFSHIVAVLDGSTKYRVSPGARALLRELVDQQEVQESPVGTTADEVLLRLARAYMTAGHVPSIVSNDAFREFELARNVPRAPIFVDAMDTIIVL